MRKSVGLTSTIFLVAAFARPSLAQDTPSVSETIDCAEKYLSPEPQATPAWLEFWAQQENPITILQTVTTSIGVNQQTSKREITLLRKSPEALELLEVVDGEEHLRHGVVADPARPSKGEASRVSDACEPSTQEIELDGQRRECSVLERIVVHPPDPKQKDLRLSIDRTRVWKDPKTEGSPSLLRIVRTHEEDRGEGITIVRRQELTTLSLKSLRVFGLQEICCKVVAISETIGSSLVAEFKQWRSTQVPGGVLESVGRLRESKDGLWTEVRTSIELPEREDATPLENEK
jgi:hypothetical protein